MYEAGLMCHQNINQPTQQYLFNRSLKIITIGKIDLFKNYCSKQNRSLNIITVDKIIFFKLSQWVKSILKNYYYG